MQSTNAAASSTKRIVHAPNTMEAYASLLAFIFSHARNAKKGIGVPEYVGAILIYPLILYNQLNASGANVMCCSVLQHRNRHISLQTAISMDLHLDLHH